METRVKERLVGAVILVALIVALVPEILSGPRKPDPAASGGTEQPLRTYTIDLEERGFPAGESSSDASPALQPAPAETPAPTTESPGEPNGASPTIESQPSPEPPAAPAESRNPEPASPEESNGAQPGAVVAATGWAVQLGSFSNAENAERLASELRARGYRAFVSPYESGGQKRSRVRVGPETDRARAEQLAERLRREGRQAAVVAHP